MMVGSLDSGNYHFFFFCLCSFVWGRMFGVQMDKVGENAFGQFWGDSIGGGAVQEMGQERSVEDASFLEGCASA